MNIGGRRESVRLRSERGGKGRSDEIGEQADSDHSIRP